MRSLPSLNGNDKPGAQAASTSDVRKLANRCWNINPSKTAPPPQPLPGPRWDGSRPTSIRSLPILPSQRTPCADLPDTLHHDKQSHSGLRGSSTEPFPAFPSQCRTSSKQSSLSLPRTDVDRGRRGKRKKPSRRYREVFVWDHRTSIGSDPGTISITKETNISLETNSSMGLAVDNHGRNMYTPNGQARLKRKQRTQGLLGMLDRPLELDQLCKTPIPHTALTNKSSSKMSFPSNTIVLPPIGQDYDTSTSGYNPRSERELSETTRVEQTHKKPEKRKTRAKKGLKSKMAQKEKMKPQDSDMDVKNEGTSDAYGSEDDDDDDGGGGDDNDNNSDMGWTDDDDDDYESVEGFLVASRVNSQMRKSACSTSRFSRASGFTMSSVEIKMSGDDGDEDGKEGDDDDDQDSECFEGSKIRKDLDDQDDDNDDDDENDGDGGDNEDKEEDCDNDSEDNEDEDDADDMEDETIKDSDDEDDEDMFVIISDYGESEDENEEENTTDAGDTAINGTENLSDAEELDEDEDENDDETSTYVEDDEASNN